MIVRCSMKLQGGGEASIVAEIVEVEENSSQKMQTFRMPPVLTFNKSAAYALYELTYIRDVAYKPEEYYVKTRKCEPDADAKVEKICERLRDENSHIIEHTEPICCPCGPQRRVPSSCGNVCKCILACLHFFKFYLHNASCHLENRTAISNDNFLPVNLIGDFVGYTNIPSFEDFYLVIPKQYHWHMSFELCISYGKSLVTAILYANGFAKENVIGQKFTTIFALCLDGCVGLRERFSLDGVECNKIGVSYEAFNGQPNLCSLPFWSCLHNQLWNFWEVYDAIQKKLVLDPDMTKVRQALSIPAKFREWRWLLSEHRKEVGGLPPAEDIERWKSRYLELSDLPVKREESSTESPDSGKACSSSARDEAVVSRSVDTSPQRRQPRSSLATNKSSTREVLPAQKAHMGVAPASSAGIKRLVSEQQEGQRHAGGSGDSAQVFARTA
ncbi:hypothetical protein PRUPE_8G039500 [Prunus persica]|uniref:Generative cell specific-1/HAP2 domain-containing protein n=1 Tax=Prunus persica TaxID=3760 RepID=A0A251MSN8_PRUPE|nr:hypothetical protein PRUPE_8G039500 [Prunus persica]